MKKVLLMALLTAAICIPQTSGFAAEYKIDPVHSSSLFRVLHYGTSYIYGTLPDVGGVISFNEADPESSTVEVNIKTATLTTHNAGRDRHLSGPDFFNVKEFPVMTFESSSWKKTGDKAYTVTGDLHLLGVKKTVTATIEHVGTGKHPRTGKELIGFHVEFTIDRSEFGMNYGIAGDGTGLGKDVNITVSVEAGKQ